MILRPEPHHAENAVSQQRADRITNRPKSLAALLRLLKRQYALEPPPKLHSGTELADDGDPQFTGEAQRFLGFGQRTGPNDWVAVACQTDVDGYYVTPLRCAIERMRQCNARDGRIAARVLTHFFHYSDVTRVEGIHDDDAPRVLADILYRLYDSMTAVPVPQKTVDHAMS